MSKFEEYEAPKIEPWPFSDDALALEFADHHHTVWRYVAKWKKWYRWTGARWEEDCTKKVQELIRLTCRSASKQANQGQTAIASTKKVGAVMTMADADERIAATIDQWDNDPMLLGTPGGSVNLRTGEMRPSNPSDYITKSTRATPGGDCPLFKSSVLAICKGDQNLVDYIQRLGGYCLTGVNTEHVLPFWYGLGRNGKNTITDVFVDILGDYATIIPMGALVVSQHQEHATEIAKLRGIRFALASETNEDSRWNTGRIKSLTGDGWLTGRFMRTDFFDFRATHKLCVIGNKKPKIGTIDKAIADRFQVVPFEVTFEDGDFEETDTRRKKDSKLMKKLQDEYAGILRWMIEGCLRWQKIGLAPPESVLAATRGYIAAEDRTQLWIEEMCSTEANDTAFSSELFESWKTWAETRGYWLGDNGDLRHRLEAKGFAGAVYTGRMRFRGIKPLSSTEASTSREGRVAKENDVLKAALAELGVNADALLEQLRRKAEQARRAQDEPF